MKGNSMKKVDNPQPDDELAYLESVRDEDIDFSDIPEIKTLEMAIKGKFYRPLK